MANDPNSEYEVLHLGAWLFVTPFQDWHNERALAKVPERIPFGRELTKTNRGMVLVRQRPLRDEFHEELPPPAFQVTCGLGPPRRVRICMCRRGDHK